MIPWQDWVVMVAYWGGIFCSMFWGVLLSAGVVMIIRQAIYNQQRKKWAKEIRPGKGLGL